MTKLLASLSSLLLSTAIAHADRRIASAGDIDPSDPNCTLLRATGTKMGASGFIVDRAQAECGLGGFGKPLLGDDHGVPVVLARGGETFANTGKPYFGYSDDEIRITTGGTFIVFGASSTTPTIASWDASRGLRAILAEGDQLPGGGTAKAITVAGANAAGQVLMSVLDNGSNGRVVLAQADGTLVELLRRGQSVPGAAGNTIVTFGKVFLADDGSTAVEAFAIDSQNQGNGFILVGQPGSLTLEIGSSNAPDNKQAVSLLAASPAGQIAYVVTNDDGTINGNRLRIRVGAAGATTTVLDQSGQSTLDVGGYGFSGNNISHAILANNDELAVEAIVKHGASTTTAILELHDFGWRMIAASDQTIDGRSLASPSVIAVGPRGKVLFNAGSNETVWSFESLAQPVVVLSAGASYDTGPLGMRQAVTVGGVGMSDEENLTYAFSWKDDNGNLRTTIKTTEPSNNNVDLAITTVQVDTETFTESTDLAIGIVVENLGTSPATEYALTVEIPNAVLVGQVIGFEEDGVTPTVVPCTEGIPGTFTCHRFDVEPGAHDVVVLSIVLIDSSKQTVITAVVDAPGDVDHGNDTGTLTVDGDDDGGCSTGHGGQLGWLLLALPLMVRRRRA